MEPHRLRRWRRASTSERLDLFTCARPGRSKGKDGQVSEALVDKWIGGLPAGSPVVVLSLLGRKPGGLSEYSFYSFSGGDETDQERGCRPAFQQWIDQRQNQRRIVVVEHPTTDFVRVEPRVLEAVVEDLEKWLAEGATVVLVDSGGDTRTKQVCKYAEFVEDSRE